MRVSLVSVPWQLLATPSLPLGALKARTRACRNHHEIRTRHANPHRPEYLREASGGPLAPECFDYLANTGVWHGMGDRVFTPALHGAGNRRREHYRSYPAEHGVDPGEPEGTATRAVGFISAPARETVAAGPGVIGFSSTFQQNVPSLAAARSVEGPAPGTPALFGGGCCEAPVGPAIARNFPFVGHVISGEARRSYVEFLGHLEGLRAVEEVGRISWTAEEGSTVTNAFGAPSAMGEIPCPEFDTCFQELEERPLRPSVKPTPFHEAAFGCWWGEKHTCPFCGLYGLTMKFRSRPPERVRTRLGDLVRRHQIPDIVTVDNILDMEYSKTLLPELAGADMDLNPYCEISRDRVLAPGADGTGTGTGARTRTRTRTGAHTRAPGRARRRRAGLLQRRPSPTPDPCARPRPAGAHRAGRAPHLAGPPGEPGHARGMAGALQARPPALPARPRLRPRPRPRS